MTDKYDLTHTKNFRIGPNSFEWGFFVQETSQSWIWVEDTHGQIVDYFFEMRMGRG